MQLLCYDLLLKEAECGLFILDCIVHGSARKLYSHNHPLFWSFRVSQQWVYCLQEILYLSMWWFNFYRTTGELEKHNFKREKKQQQYIDHGSFNYSFQGNCQQMFLCVCVQSISWSVIHSQVIVRHDQRDDNIRLTRDNMADTNN